MADSRPLAHELPNEIVDHIFASADSRDNALCHSLCLVNKSANKAFTPLLYSRIDFSKAPQKGRETAHVIERRRKMKALSRTLAQKPRLMHCVKEVSQYIDEHSGQYTADSKSEGMDNFDRKYAQRWKALLDKTKTGTDDMVDNIIYYLECKHRISEEAFLCLLLLLCTNVIRLELTGDLSQLPQVLDYLNDDGFSTFGTFSFNLHGTLSSSVKRRNTGFDNIRELVFNHSVRRHDQRMELWDFCQLFELPSLQKVSTNTLTTKSIIPHRTTSDVIADILGDDPVGQSNDYLTYDTIKELEISRFGIQNLDSLKITAYFPNITSLRIEWEPLQDFHSYWDWRRIGDSIRHLHQLEHLTLDSKAPRIDKETPILPTIGLGGLRPWMTTDYQTKGCPNLQTLTLPKSAIFGSHGDQIRTSGNIEHYYNPFIGEGGYETMTLENFLPYSVEELGIICDDVVFTQEDRDLLTNPGSERLKNLTIYNVDKSRWISKKDGKGSTA